MNTTRIIALSLALAAAACGPTNNGTDAGSDGSSNPADGASGSDASSEASTPEDSGGLRTPVTIAFTAQVGSSAFSCDQTYRMQGTGNSTWTPKDFRFYVHDVRLVTGSGEVPVAISTFGMFQGQNVALLDFEDGSNSCTEGTPDTNRQIVGNVAMASLPADIRGLKFKLGVPFALNHNDAASAPAPLNLTAMWWAWNSGYKFLKIDGSTAGLPMGFNIHVGSTGCTGNNMGAVNACSAPNVAEITLDGWTPTSNIIADLGALISMSNLETSTMAPGCMSGGTDPECAPIFSALGLPIAGAPAGTQRFFRLEGGR